VKSALKYAALLAGAVVFAYPFLWMLAGSLKPELEIASLISFRGTSPFRATHRCS